MNNETIAALSTAPYKAALGVIRVSGNNAVGAVNAIFSKDLSQIASSSVIHGCIVSGGEAVDDVLVSVFLAPKSFTGEDTVEISCHGGVFNCRRILKMLIDNGVRQARNGEFTQRAFLHGKLDLAQAEAIVDLIDSESKAEASAAMKQLGGALSVEINSISKDLTDISAQLLAYIDYPDDEIDPPSHEELENAIINAKNRVDKLIKSYDSGKIIKNGLKTVIVGKPNVGKSMLMNRLLGEDRSIVTDIAGTTRDVIEESAEFAGLKLVLSDTAGVRETDDIIEKLGVDRTLKKITEADLILCVFDGSSTLSDDDFAIIDSIKKSDAKKIAVFNKSDKGTADSNLTFDGKVKISALTGDGISDLENEIKRLFPDGSEETCGAVMNLRHYECLLSAKKVLDRAFDNISMTPDALVSDISDAIEALGAVTGKTVSEQIIDNIFSRFCVGK